jgi:hypothetical protein
MENRSSLTDYTRISVACRRLTANSPVLQGKMLDCSQTGTCIELNQKIQDGSIVMINASVGMKEDLPALPEGFRSFALAEVKWSKPIEDASGNYYAIGLSYLPN